MSSSSSSSFFRTWEQLSSKLKELKRNGDANQLTSLDTSVNLLLNDIRDYIYYNSNTLDIISDATKAKTLNHDMTDLYQYAFYKNIGILISLCCSFLIIKNYHTINI
jgi:hypothetical protein